MAKQSGTTKSVGSGGAAASRTSAPVSGGNIADKMGMTERQFASITGTRYGLSLTSYQTSLAIANEVPDNQTMWTGHKAKEVKDTLKKIIRAMGGSTNVKMNDFFKDE